MSESSAMLPREGERLGAGVLLSLISTGGSAYVYKTWIESLEIHRAVKVMSPDAEPDVRDRFSTEARINAKLVHPNIVQCHNFGATENGLPYLEMEYIAGPALSAVLEKKGALPVPVALSIALGVAEALAYAHQVKYTLYDKHHIGLIHRDLKPANILLSPDGVAKLMDFGIARPVGFSFHTIAGTVPGTIAYLSPEACAGSDPDFRSDIYQLGLTLHEMLSGAPAFPHTNLAALLKDKEAGKIRPVESFSKDVPPEVSSFLNACTALNPSDRFQTAALCLVACRELFTTVCGRIGRPEDIIQSFLEGHSLSLPVNDARKGTPKLKTALVSASVVIVLAGSALAFMALKAPYQADARPQAGPGRGGVVAKTALPADAQPPVTSPKPLRARYPGVSGPRACPGPLDAGNARKTLSREDAALYIDKGRGLYSEGRLAEALACFQKALRTPSDSPRDDIVRKSVYHSALCNAGLFKAGKVPASNFKAAWVSVMNTYPEGSTEHTEAIKRLKGEN